jgi:hypothetical protein
VPAQHRGDDGVERHRRQTAHGEEADEGERGDRDRDERADRRGDGDQGEPLRQHGLRRAEHQPAAADGDDGEERDVGAERADAAVREEQPLHEQHDREAECRGERTHQDGGQSAAQQVAAGAGAHREVDHLRGEDERRDEPGHRGGTVVEFAAGAPEGQGHPGRRHHAGLHRGGGVEPSVGNVHVPHTTLLHITCNNRPTGQEHPHP